MKLNETAIHLAQALIGHAQRANVTASVSDCGTSLVDCGVNAVGGVATGCRLAEICLAGLGEVRVESGRMQVWSGPWVTVTTDQPIAACMASQYAGWPLSYGSYFAMGSGPMRAARGREPLFDKIGFLERPTRVVGVLESGQMPGDDICRDIARQCQVAPEELTLLVARTASLAGTIQIVARSVETALHKLSELEFDLTRILAGFGLAPLPPVAGDDLTGIGRTNDAVLYGAVVTLWVRGDDESLRSVGPRLPSCSSPDYGRPFQEIFEHYQRDFYRIDPLLFSPSEVHLVNVDTGGFHRFGEAAPRILRKSFGVEQSAGRADDEAGDDGTKGLGECE